LNQGPLRALFLCLKVAAVQAEARVAPERAQGHHLVRLGQRLAAVPFHGAPGVTDADASHHAKAGSDDQMGDLS